MALINPLLIVHSAVACVPPGDGGPIAISGVNVYPTPGLETVTLVIDPRPETITVPNPVCVSS